MKRGTDHVWKLIKFKEDIAIYAKCKCGYFYACSQSARNEDGSPSFKQIPTYFHRYCPNCGARKKYHTVDVADGGWLYK